MRFNITSVRLVKIKKKKLKNIQSTPSACVPPARASTGYGTSNAATRSRFLIRSGPTFYELFSFKTQTYYSDFGFIKNEIKPTSIRT